jgi:hypothetical protein
MAALDTDHLLEMLRDPNVESRDVAAAAGVAREDAARAARVVAAIAKATPEDALPLPAPLAIAIARAALAAGRADLLAALAAHPGKEASKEAKRGLHLLKSRGVAVPEPPRPAPPPASPTVEAPLPCYATVIDGQGERAVWMPRAVPGKGVEIAQAVISDTQGLLELQLGVIGRKEWRKLLEGLLDKGRAMGIAEIDPARALGLVAAARALNDRSGQHVPEQADLWLGQHGPAAPVEDPPAPGPLPEAQERDALAASGALHLHPLFATWMADEAFLREVAAKLDEVSVSPLYVDDLQRSEQLVRTVADAVERYLDDGRRAALVRRLNVLAGDLAARGDADRASSAAAAARALAAGAPARAVPFARVLVEKAFPGVSAAPPPPAEPPAPDSPLVVAPR